jgi:hypothetical protein
MIKNSCRLDERELILSQRQALSEKRAALRSGKIYYKGLELPSSKVELVMDVALRFLVYGPGTWWEREERLLISRKSDSVAAAFARMDGTIDQAISEATHYKGRSRALKYWRKHLRARFYKAGGEAHDLAT